MRQEISSNFELFLPPANEVWGRVICLHLSVILSTGGVLSQHALQVISQHALQQVSREGAIPACIAGGIPAFLAAGLRGGSPGPQPRGKWRGSGPAPQPRGKLRGIWSRPTAKGEVEGDLVQAHTQGGS